MRILERHLKPSAASGRIQLWIDQEKLQSGDYFQDDITAAIQESAAAIILVSDSFQASNFVQETELPCILDRSDEGKLRLFWIKVSDCSMANQLAAKIQSTNGSDASLAELDESSKSKIHTIFTRLAGELEEHIAHSQEEPLTSTDSGTKAKKASILTLDTKPPRSINPKRPRFLFGLISIPSTFLLLLVCALLWKNFYQPNSAERQPQEGSILVQIAKNKLGANETRSQSNSVVSPKSGYSSPSPREFQNVEKEIEYSFQHQHPTRILLNSGESVEGTVVERNKEEIRVAHFPPNGKFMEKKKISVYQISELEPIWPTLEAENSDPEGNQTEKPERSPSSNSNLEPTKRKGIALLFDNNQIWNANAIGANLRAKIVDAAPIFLSKEDHLMLAIIHPSTLYSGFWEGKSSEIADNERLSFTFSQPFLDFRLTGSGLQPMGLVEYITQTDFLSKLSKLEESHIIAIVSAATFNPPFPLDSLDKCIEDLQERNARLDIVIVISKNGDNSVLSRTFHAPSDLIGFHYCTSDLTALQISSATPED